MRNNTEQQEEVRGMAVLDKLIDHLQRVLSAVEDDAALQVLRQS